jgi:hypothetical protein
MYSVKCIAVSSGKLSVLFPLLLLPLFLLTASRLPAQNGRLGLSLALEGNMNTLSGASGAASFSAALDLGRMFAAGLKIGYSSNFSGMGILKMAALGHWYFFSFEISRLFAQIELGADLIFYEQQTIPAFLGGWPWAGVCLWGHGIWIPPCGAGTPMSGA